jgi:hypothetical protein
MIALHADRWRMIINNLLSNQRAVDILQSTLNSGAVNSGFGRDVE